MDYKTMQNNAKFFSPNLNRIVTHLIIVNYCIKMYKYLTTTA